MPFLRPSVDDETAVSDVLDDTCDGLIQISKVKP
jgi:hypothetical protein